MKLSELTIHCDTKATAISPRRFADALQMIEALYILGTYIKDQNIENISSGEMAIFFKHYMDMYSDMFAPFARLERDGKPRLPVLHFNNDELRRLNVAITSHEVRISDLVHMRASEDLRIIELHYKNPLEVKFLAGSGKYMKSLIIAVIVCGGEVNIKEGKVNFPGLISVVERVSGLITGVKRENELENLDKSDDILLEVIQKQLESTDVYGRLNK